MNDDELETRLLALRPAPLPENLRQRLQSARPRPLWPILGLLGAAMAVVVTMTRLAGTFTHPSQPSRMMTTTQASPSSSSSSSTAPPLSPEDLRVFLPIQQTSTLVKVENYGLLETDPQRPIRLMRTTWLDDVTYRGDDGVTTLQRKESRTEIVPVALHTY